jgi:hypothetical protein
MMLKTLCAAVLLLLAGSAQAEPQKAVKTAAPEKAAPPCPKIDFTVADVVRKRKRSSTQRTQHRTAWAPAPGAKWLNPPVHSH